MALSVGSMEINIKASSKPIISKDMEDIPGLTDVSTKASGRIIKCTARALLSGLMAANMRDSI